MEKYRIEHSKVYEYDSERKAYVYCVNTLSLQNATGMSKITSKNVNAAVSRWEEQCAREAYENGEDMSPYND